MLLVEQVAAGVKVEKVATLVSGSRMMEVRGDPGDRVRRRRANNVNCRQRNWWGSLQCQRGGACEHAVGDNNPFQFIGRAMAFFGGHGGNGGQGGNGASLLCHRTNDIVIPPGNGANGGNGSKGGLALGGSIYSTGGSWVESSSCSRLWGQHWSLSGSGGSRGGGGAAAEEEREGSDGALGSAGRSEGGFLWSSAGTVRSRILNSKASKPSVHMARQERPGVECSRFQVLP